MQTMTVQSAIASGLGSQAIVRSVANFTEMVEGAADLKLHRQVDETIEAIAAEVKFLRALTDNGASVREAIAGARPKQGQLIDPEDKLVDDLAELISRYEGYLSREIARKGCIDRDHRLNESHCEMLHSSYDQLLVEIACLTQVAKDIRAAIIAHDLAAETRSGKTYGSVAELAAALRS